VHGGDQILTPLLGLVGKTNVGKSTFFSAATMIEVPAENRPFVTIDPNVGVAYVRKRCAHVDLGLPKCDPVDGVCMEGWRFMPVKLVDVAGLVPNASEGRGLGTKFLDEVRKADALLVVVDASGSTDAEGNPVPPGTHDPVEDVNILLKEFSAWMAKQLLKDWKSFALKATTLGVRASEALKERLSGFSVKEEHILKALNELNLDENLTKWSTEDVKKFVEKLVELRPKVIVANKADVDGAEKGVERLREAYPRVPVVPTSAAAELILRKAAKSGAVRYVPGDPGFEVVDENKLSSKQKKILKIIEEKVFNKWGNTGVVQSLNEAVFGQLDMVVVYPVHDAHKFTDSEGRVLPEARLVPKGTKLKDFAALVHSDLARGFLYAIDARSGRRLGADAEVYDGLVVKIVSASR